MSDKLEKYGFSVNRRVLLKSMSSAVAVSIVGLTGYLVPLANAINKPVKDSRADEDSNRKIHKAASDIALIMREETYDYNQTTGRFEPVALKRAFKCKPASAEHEFLVWSC